jgi:hypothetical protein
MKPLYLSLGCLLWWAACTSPAAQKTAQRATPQKDTIAATDTMSVQRTAASQLPPDYMPVLFEYPTRLYDLDSMQALVKKISSVEEPDGDISIEALDEKTYASLSLPQQFTYHFIHPEAYSQNCDGFPLQEDTTHRIYGHLDDNFGEYEWSERQINFLKNNRDTVMQLMKPYIERDNEIYETFKEALVIMNAKEMIPYMIDVYNRKKNDHYILTLLLLLMKNNRYPEFMHSTSYTKLYGKPANDNEYGAYLVYNKANEELIIQRATNFYNGLQAKK